jgi:hypothetical protein
MLSCRKFNQWKSLALFRILENLENHFLRKKRSELTLLLKTEEAEGDRSADTPPAGM